AIPAAGLLAGAALGLLLSDSQILQSWRPAVAGPMGVLLLACIACAGIAWAFRDGARRLRAEGASASLAEARGEFRRAEAGGFSRVFARTFGVWIALGFAAGGTLLSSAAWQRAWRSPLRVQFEQLARRQRAEAESQGRRLPEDE